MAKIQCPSCLHKWLLREATTNRCPKCGAVVEIYFSRAEAKRVADIYNRSSGAGQGTSGVRKLIGINGFSVAFPDAGRLAAIADQLIER